MSEPSYRTVKDSFRGLRGRADKARLVREHAGIGTDAWDGLRGLAILLVLLFHTWLFSWFTPELSVFGFAIPLATPVRTGYLGVEIFFVISGFVLALPYARAGLAGRPLPGTVEFARRRFWKIVPSYALALGFTALSVLGLTPHPASLAGTLVNHVAFVQNFFNDQLGPANSVFWSLAIEVQFYLVFPLLAAAFVRKPAVTAAAMLAVALAYRYETARCCLQVEVVTRQLPAFLDLFACGMVAALVTVRFGERATTPRARLAWTALAALAVAAGYFLLTTADAQTYVPGGKERWIAADRTLVGVVVAVFGVASSHAQSWWRRAVANRGFTFLALISYNLYLWHTLVLIWMWKHGVPPAATADPHDDPHWKLPYIASGWLASVAIATAITYFVERPLLPGRRHPFSFDRRALRLRPIAPSEKRT